MDIKKVKYENDEIKEGNTGMIATIDNIVMYVPLDPANRHYQAIQEWVAEGNTIEDAD
tara:strand:+ start:1545 stop:1718 length:174 start_codon:yes stop_codon:yes gene_type:complete